MKWGTSNPIMMRDQDYGVVRVRGFGVYSFAVGTPTNALRELIGSMSSFTVRNVDDYFKKIITSTLSNVIAESNIPALDLAMHYDDLAQMAKSKLSDEFEKIGIEIKSLVIENLSLPEEVEKMLDKRTNVGVMKGAMREYTQMESVEAMKSAAKNPGGMSGLGVGMGAGVSMGKMFVDSMSSISNSRQESVVEEKVQVDDYSVCPNCHSRVPSSSKFCPECGNNMIPPKKVCPACGAEVGKAKFCPECGAKVDEIRCKVCGKVLKPNQKFCPDCGTKQD